MLEYRKLITRGMLRAERDTLFVFGDNMVRQGLGGQAREMRGEINAIGVVTKLAPSNREGAFFNNSMKNLIAWRLANARAFERLRTYKGKIVWPLDGIGTGLAQLQQRAPQIWDELEAFRKELEEAD